MSSLRLLPRRQFALPAIILVFPRMDQFGDMSPSWRPRAESTQFSTTSPDTVRAGSTISSKTVSSIKVAPSRFAGLKGIATIREYRPRGNAMSCQFSLSTKVALCLFLVLICSPFPVAKAQVLKAFSTEDFRLARPRITQPIDNAAAVRIPGTRPRVLDRSTDLGRMDGGRKLGPLLLVLKSSAEQEHALQTLIDLQQDKSTPYYHRWLTPDEFGAAFGVEESDLQQICEWLTKRGFTVQDIGRGRRTITFTGTAEQVETTFQTELHNLLVDGERHFANTQDIAIPAALSSVVAGVTSLDDLKPKHLHSPVSAIAGIPATAQGVEPDFTSGGQHYLTPGDFAVIYSTQPLLQGTTGGLREIDGSGQTIAVLGSSTAIKLPDPNIQKFRQLFLYSYIANNTVAVATNDCIPPTGTDTGEEAYLDLEWAGAIAPGATIAFVNVADVICGANWIVQNYPKADIISMSENLAELNNTSSSYRQVVNTWKQASRPRDYSVRRGW